MRYSYSFPALAFAVQSVAAGQYDDWKFGNMFTFGSSSSTIKKATYSLIPPSVPCGTVTASTSNQPWMSIWVGVSPSISDENADLFQPLLNWAPNNAQEGCSAPDNEWCVAASTYFSTGQVGQAYVEIPTGADVAFEIDVDSTSSNAVTQKVWINDKLVSQQTDKFGNDKAPSYIYSSNECYLGTCGTLDAYTWSNLTIVLEAADSTFGSSLQLTGATASEVTTSDNGKTWHVESIKINEDYFYSDGSKKQC